ncbi:MAG: type IV secretion system DNA-binding domain-containing protein [Sphingobium sp.]|nr:type IV secretion system DNA-binding domain-containing protein [Sphingobium sp.]
MFKAEAFTFDPDAIPPVLETLDAGVKLRERLRGVITILQHEAHYLAVWRRKLLVILVGLLNDLPVNALVDPALDGTVETASVLRPETPLALLVDDLPVSLTKLMGTFADEDVSDTPLFADLRLQFERRLCAASGIVWEDRHKSSRPILLPWDQTKVPCEELASLYTDDTIFAGFFDTPVPIPVPLDVRFEHTHILGGTGHGKTQLLQLLIADDLRRCLRERQSVVVLDPDGTLIKTISQLAVFGDGLLGERTIIIDPTDVGRPVGLNLFDVSSVEGADARARETIENNTIELFEYFFTALLGSELTGRQATLFRYLGLLLMRIPNGNIHTLCDLMTDGKPYRPYMEALDGSARAFFATQFFHPSLNATKQQVLSRLWGILSNRSLDRVFSATKNSVNFDAALQAGSIIFVHTAKESLGEEGSAVFARMMVALLSQSLIRRAALPATERTPTFIYLDEAEGVVDETLVRMLAQVRKYRGALTIAHQHLDQLPATVRAGVLANTSIKLAGGVSAKDASALAPEYRTTADFILGQRKEAQETAFALFAKNITPTAMRFPVPLGLVERMDRLSASGYEALIERSRERYGNTPPAPVLDVSPVQAPPADVPQPVRTVAPSSVPAPVMEAVFRKEGGGGVRHREIQAMIQELGEAAGFRVSIEEVILEGEGRVDVILRRDALTICCEVSVTTTKEHELLNVQKCLRFGADQVWLIVSNAERTTSTEKFMVPHLEEVERDKFAVKGLDDLHSAFATFGVPAPETEKIVRGYKVRSKQSREAVGVFLRKSLDTLE